MRKTCFYHAGCPDGFGAAYAVWRAWGDSGRYVGRGHDDRTRAEDHEGDFVVFVDIAPANGELRELGEAAAHVVVLDHHHSAHTRLPRRYPAKLPATRGITAATSEQRSTSEQRAG